MFISRDCGVTSFHMCHYYYLHKDLPTAYRPKDNAHGGCLLLGPLILDLEPHSCQTPCTVHISAASSTVNSAITRVPVLPVAHAVVKRAVGWCDPNFITRSSITRDLTRRRLSRCSTRDYTRAWNSADFLRNKVRCIQTTALKFQTLTSAKFGRELDVTACVNGKRRSDVTITDAFNCVFGRRHTTAAPYVTQSAFYGFRTLMACFINGENTRLIVLALLNTAVTICTVPPGSTFNNSTFCPHIAFKCFVWIWEQTAIISTHDINWLVFVTEI